MKVRWTPQALQDRTDIWDYLVVRDTQAALAMDQAFSDALPRLRDFPMSGHEGRISGTRELIPHPSYRLVYEISGDTVWILALIHTARQWPPVKGSAGSGAAD
ncbi:type II toxin-antitoxin system RelE/ParE family toxin [Brevundimonas sp. VNH65]|uniref:type II toxin-antitoxin system RelE/ParE family toxin n=1 Tax=Brevundimonas sp. VNH65 TaxID=3400917 RepID=UPI003C095D2A